MNLYPEWVINSTWYKIIKIGSQVLVFNTGKIFIHIPAHILLGLIPAWLGFLVFWGAGLQSMAVWVGFAIGCTVGATIFGYQIFWENIYTFGFTDEEIKERRSCILMNILDFLEYVFGAASVLFMLLLF